MIDDPKVTVLITGGTVDSAWDSSRDTAVVGQESIVPEYFNRIKLDIPVECKVLFLKDSREIMPEDMRTICEAVDSAATDKVLITHGTYTMPDTARYLAKNMKSDKAVVLTGSLIPLRGYELSDAGFNIGFAMAKLLELQGGVRLVLHGRIFTTDEVIKNLAQGRFFSVDAGK